MSELNNVNTGMSLPGVLLVVFVVLKLVGVINWSWWLVLMPLWITLGLYGLIVLVIILGIILHGSAKPSKRG